jgi:hypothetical protein
VPIDFHPYKGSNHRPFPFLQHAAPEQTLVDQASIVAVEAHAVNVDPRRSTIEITSNQVDQYMKKYHVADE